MTCILRPQTLPQILPLGAQAPHGQNAFLAMVDDALKIDTADYVAKHALTIEEVFPDPSLEDEAQVNVTLTDPAGYLPSSVFAYRRLVTTDWLPGQVYLPLRTDPSDLTATTTDVLAQLATSAYNVYLDASMVTLRLLASGTIPGAYQAALDVEDSHYLWYGSFDFFLCPANALALYAQPGFAHSLTVADLTLPSSGAR